MSADRIEREIVIAASIERVWSLVAQPGFWVSDNTGLADVTAKEGESMNAKNAEREDIPVRVEKVERPTFLAYRWVSAYQGEELREDNSTLVEFTLTQEGDQTRLRVVESGFAALPGSEELRESVVADHTTGWEYCFDTLKKRAEDTSA
jgi:uncharacterized protein YndB with AHSA1/START domain